MIPTKTIKGWVDYEVKEGLFVITEVDYDARGNTVETKFENIFYYFSKMFRIILLNF